MPQKPFSVTSWNVNSLRARHDRVFDWIDRHQPDVLCLQETKVTDDKFPVLDFTERGYQVDMFGQKTYNGVCIASKHDMHTVQKGFPGDDDDAQKRLIAADISGIRIVNVYVVNGQAVGSDKYAFKMAWLTELRKLLKTWIAAQPLLVCGDFNIAPEDRDVYDADAWRGKILCSDDERAQFQQLVELGLTDAFRCHEADTGHYTWWDYRTGMWDRRQGLRIDHHLVTASLVDRCTYVEIDEDEREVEHPGFPGVKASDHAPITAFFSPHS